MHISDWAGVATVAMAILTIVAAVAGLVDRAAKKREARTRRWIHEEIVKPVREAHHQLTVNEHASDFPTVLDRIEDVKDDVANMRRRLEEVQASGRKRDTDLGASIDEVRHDQALLTRTLAKHLRDSRDESGKITNRIDELSQQLAERLTAYGQEDDGE